MSNKVRVDNLDKNQIVKQGYNKDGKLLISDYYVSDDDDINRLKDIGVHICYLPDDESSPDPTTEENTETRGKAADSEDNLTTNEIINDEIDNLTSLVEKTEKTYEKAIDKTEEIFHSVHQGESDADELRELEPFIEKFQDYMEESTSSISILTQIERYDESTFDHSINVSILALVYASHLEYDDKETFHLGVGGLLHDIGKTKLSRQIIQKDGDLTEEEWDIIKQHPSEGYDILKDAGYDKKICNIAHQHHERPDGSGYPNQLESFGKFPRIISVIDAYEALTAPRPYRNPMNPLKAYSVLKDDFFQYDQTRSILESLIQCMGLFPVGCIVKLTNDDLAVVLENNPSSLKYPRVKIINIGGTNKVRDPFEVDLNHIQQQKQSIQGRIYDSEIEIEKVLKMSKIPELRKAIPEIIYQN